MARQFQVCIDCADPRMLGGFWAEALDYVEESPPAGFDSWPEALTAWGLPEEQHNDAYAVVDPGGAGPRLFLHRVPEHKTVKNRLHLDIRVSNIPGNDAAAKGPILSAEAERLAGHGATVVRTEHDEMDYFVVMQDPEGNEFCLT